MVKLQGSVPAIRADVQSLGPAPADERCDVTVLVRPRTPLAPHAHDVVPGKRAYLTRAEFAARHGASEADFDAVAAFAQGAGLAILERRTAARSIVLSGTVGQVTAAFGTAIERVEHAAGISRRRTAPIQVPPALDGIVEAVFGIDDVPVAKPHFQFSRQDAQAALQASLPLGAAPPDAQATTGFTGVDMAKLYDFPAGLDGSGQCIAIIELGGGYRSADLTAYFKSLGLAAPQVTAVSVDGGRNSPSLPSSADAEVMLDIEVAGAVAPKAAIAVYFAPNSEQGFVDAIAAAVHDDVRKPSVISISWGAPESAWTQQGLAAMDAAFQAAAALGVTVCCAAGDAGADDQNPDNGTPDGRAHADFPASSPYVLGRGGTRITVSGGAIASETAWNDDPASSATGGGVSDVFDLPAWQAHAGVPPSINPDRRIGRGVPDVAGNASPATGYQVRVDYMTFTIGGTSAVSPLWAGLVALLNQKLAQPAGWLNPLLYGPLAGSGALRDIASGDNGGYTARAGWDACTGWGVPVGTRLLAALEG
jgi:kumamolisin